MKEVKVELCVLDPLDYIFFRLRIGTVEDEEDSLKIVKMFSFTDDLIKERFSSINKVKNIEFFLFEERFKNFIRQLREG